MGSDASAPQTAPVEATILIVDADDSARPDLVTQGNSCGYHVEAAGTEGEALAALSRTRFDLILLDIRVGGLALLREILRRIPHALVVLVATPATAAEAAEAIRAGASDYVAKPQSAPQLELLLRRLLTARSQRLDYERERVIPDAPYFLESTSPAMKRTIAMARQAAAADVPVLLTGEAGTGKRVLARAIHEWSARRAGPFVTVACAALAEQFAATRTPQPPGAKLVGPGTSADMDASRLNADGGTLLFHDVRDLTAELQGRLVRSLDDHRFGWATGDDTDVEPRAVAATTHDLEVDVRAGRFREDLFFWLNVVIAVPPLREREEDLPALSDHLLARLAARYRRGVMRLARATRRILASYRWPGNVLELLSVLEGAVVLTSGDTITPSDLPERLLTAVPTASAAEVPPPILTLDEVERQQIKLAIAQCGTLEEAAVRLGINAATLWRKRKRYGLA